MQVHHFRYLIGQNKSIREFGRIRLLLKFVNRVYLPRNKGV